MKPLIYYDFKSINETEVAIDKVKLKAILDEVYNAGFADGQAQVNKLITYNREYEQPYISNLKDLKITCVTNKSNDKEY